MVKVGDKVRWTDYGRERTGVVSYVAPLGKAARVRFVCPVRDIEVEHVMFTHSLEPV